MPREFVACVCGVVKCTLTLVVAPLQINVLHFRRGTEEKEKNKNKIQVEPITQCVITRKR